MDWNADSRSLACLLAALPPEYDDSPAGHPILVLCHAGAEACRFVVPSALRDLSWRLFFNTAAKSPRDVYPDSDGPPLPSGAAVVLESRSLVGYVAAEVT